MFGKRRKSHWKEKKKEVVALYIKGSYTIEASFVVPVLIGVLIVFIYMGFYVHNKGVMEQSAYSSGVEEALCLGKSDTEIQESIQIALNERWTNLLGVTEAEAGVLVTANKIEIRYQGKMKLPFFPGLLKIINGGEIMLSGNQKISRQNPVSFIREIRKWEKIVKKE